MVFGASPDKLRDCDRVSADDAGMPRARAAISNLDEHPNLPEILGILAQLGHVEDADLPRLAGAWINTVGLADARARALSPDAPLVLEVLAAFDAVQSLFEDDLAGEASFVTVQPQVTAIALKAIRDAIAAAYARPILSRGEHQALMRAWRAVYPHTAVEEPDLGPRGDEVKSLLATLVLLGHRCHDPEAARLFAVLSDAAWRLDGQIRDVARAETWRAACLTSRRRLWTLIRRSGIQGIRTFCPGCPPDRRAPMNTCEEQRVVELCLDAACALIVADAVDDNLTDALVLPLRQLIPEPRRSA
jgi:hypothetical protein